jgi:2-desacetyl-2-hydroxyethyl bacteriochlorophyllide A dehydrogenase
VNITTLKQRGRAALRRHLLDALDCRGLVVGTRVEFPAPGRCELRTFEEAGPGPGELLVETLATVVSAGTERANYLRLETVAIDYPHVPGYSHVGRVVIAGGGCRLQPGQIVATSAAHASLALAAEAGVLAVPHAVPPDHAAFVSIGAISLQGVRKAAILPGERVLVLGCGVIGQLAAQFARIAGGDVVVAATSTERLAVAAACGFRETIDVRAARERLSSLRADVVIDASGHPQAILDAAEGARPGARLVLLGSSRGVTRGIDLAGWQRKELTLIGAHVLTLPAADESPGAWTWKRERETVLELLSQGRLLVEPLVTRRASPGEAARVYADLARPEDRSVAVVFDWTQPGPWRARVERPSPLRAMGSTARRMLGRPSVIGVEGSQPRRDGRVLRFGLIGCGEIAVENAAALRDAANTTISFAADLEPEAARSLAAATQARFTTRVEDLLASPDVDAVLISTPHHLHASFAVQAARAGKHVVVEKPMATSVADCDRMIAAAQAAGVALSVCYVQRFNAAAQKAKALIDAGLLGQPLGSRIVFGQWRGPDYWTKGLTGRTTGDWRARRETAGGGVLIMNACHLLDYVAWLVGSEIREVTACLATLRQAVEVEDSISMSYRYACGALGTLEATTTLVGPHAHEQAIRGEHGQLVIGPDLRFWSTRTVEGYESGRWHVMKELPRVPERRRFFEAFADAVLDGTPPPVPAAEARAIQAAIEAAYAAADSGRTVTIPEGHKA